MVEQKSVSDLVVEAVSEHGKTTADLLRRVGRGEAVDYVAETLNCLANVTRTGSRFLIFWDNIATLMAADPGGPLTFPGPSLCEKGEIQTFALALESSGPPSPQSGLRRRGEVNESIPQKSIAASTKANGGVTVDVDCSGQPRGVYEGSIQIADASGNQVVQPYNVYIDPGAQKK